VAVHKDEPYSAMKEWREKNREYFRAYYEQHKEKLLEYGRPNREAKRAERLSSAA
jgi:hypothetical protein